MGAPFALGLAIAGGYSCRARPLAGGRHGGQGRRSRGFLGERLPVDNPQDEFGPRNGLHERCRGCMILRSPGRFTADASHELRTPLTAMRSVGKSRSRPRSIRAVRDVIGSMLEESIGSPGWWRASYAQRADRAARPVPEVVELAVLAGSVASICACSRKKKHQSLSVQSAARVEAVCDPPFSDSA